MKILSMFPVMIVLESQNEINFFNKYYSDIINLKNFDEYENEVVIQFLNDKIQIFDKKLKDRFYIKANLDNFLNIEAKYVIKICHPSIALDITKVADELGIRIDLLPDFYPSRCKRFIVSGENLSEFEIYLKNFGVEVKKLKN